MSSPATLPATHEAPTRLTADFKSIRASLLLLLFMTTAFGGAAWNAMRDLPTVLKPMEAIPVVLFSVVSIVVARTYIRADRIEKVCAQPVHDQDTALDQR